jgi:hypothetical protein
MVLFWVSVFMHGFVVCMCESVQVCCFMVGILAFFGFLVFNFWFIGHQTMDKV